MRFAGQLSYDPTDGLRLNYRTTELERLPKGNVLQGMLSNGKSCTLFGHFGNGHPGFSFTPGGMSWNQSGYAGMALFGANANADFRINAINFRPTRFKQFIERHIAQTQDFFSPISPIVAAIGNGSLKVKPSAATQFVGSDIRSSIFSPNKAALAKLQKVYESVRTEHPDVHFFKFSKIEYELRLEWESSVKLEDAEAAVMKVCDLLTLMSNSACYPEYLQVEVNRDEGSPVALDLMVDYRIKRDVLDLIRKHAESDVGLINLSAINFDRVLNCWLTKEAQFEAVISAARFEIGYRTHHTAQAEVVLLCSQIESIAVQMGNHKDKYNAPIRQYGTDRIRKLLEATLSTQDVGAALSNLRNEIAHVGRPRKILNKLQLRGVIRVATALHLVVRNYLLQNLEITAAVANSLIDDLTPDP
jgi:ApeA N-terminal domain 1